PRSRAHPQRAVPGRLEAGARLPDQLDRLGELLGGGLAQRHPVARRLDAVLEPYQRVLQAADVAAGDDLLELAHGRWSRRSSDEIEPSRPQPSTSPTTGLPISDRQALTPSSPPNSSPTSSCSRSATGYW